MQSGPVYVSPCDAADFVREVFLRLPPNASVVLVTGNEDVGVPRELWGAGRCAFHRNRSSGHRPKGWVPPPLCRSRDEFICETASRPWDGARTSASEGGDDSVLVRADLYGGWAGRPLNPNGVQCDLCDLCDS